MKKFIIAALALAFVISIAEAGRRREMSGTVENDVYKDKLYGFTLKMKENWKYSLRKRDDNYRLLLTQRNYEIPPDYVNSPDYTQIPRLILWTDTTSMHVFDFLDSLVSDSWDSDQKKELSKEFEILSLNPGGDSRREKAEPRGRKTVQVGGEQGILWLAKSNYLKEIALKSSDLAGKRVYGAYGGAIAAVKKGNRIFVFHLMTEWDFFQQVMEEALEIVSTLTFEGSTKPEKAKG